MDFPMDFWLFWICFIDVLFKVITNLNLTNAVFSQNSFGSIFAAQNGVLYAKEIHRLGTMDWKIYILAKNLRLWLNSWKNLRIGLLKSSANTGSGYIRPWSTRWKGAEGIYSMRNVVVVCCLYTVQGFWLVASLTTANLFPAANSKKTIIFTNLEKKVKLSLLQISFDKNLVSKNWTSQPGHPNSYTSGNIYMRGIMRSHLLFDYNLFDNNLFDIAQKRIVSVHYSSDFT